MNHHRSVRHPVADEGFPIAPADAVDSRVRNPPRKRFSLLRTVENVDSCPPRPPQVAGPISASTVGTTFTLE
ncbi:hypothetical protein D8S78_11680 [Natrialba swarupiae]|nr:hypothetical protein [Natrialba swarupiae]